MSPSPLPPKRSEPFKQPNTSADIKKYRETVYHDGRGCFTANPRRCSQVASWVETTEEATTEAAAHTPRAPRSPAQSEVPSRVRSTVLVASQTTNRTQTIPPVGQHVTVAKRAAKSRINVVVEQQKPSDALRILCPSQCYEDFQGPIRQDWVRVSTPPPTPSIKRLSTPDLSDTEDRPFCGCSTHKNVMRDCASCHREVDTWLL